jgi:peptide/nickel transport system substrate-binding protein
VYLAASAEAEGMSAAGLGYIPGEFSEQMLRVTLLDPEDGYLFNPRVTSGPYMLESYDTEENVATFRINPNFKGNSVGHKPHVERLVFQYVNESTALEALRGGEIDLINKATNDALVQEVSQLIIEATEGADVRMASYPRSGFAFLAFSCEQGPTDSQAVRQAIALSMDKDTLVANTMSHSAERVDGYYGMGQWMVSYTDEGDPTAEVEPLSIPEQLETLRTPVDIAAAQALLMSDGWTLNAEGLPYDDEQDTVRYRQVNGVLEPLRIRWAVTQESEMAGQVQQQLKQAFAMLGIELEVTELPFGELLTHYYRQTERVYNMFFLASNFNNVFDPYYTFHTSDAYQGMLNTSGLRDQELMDLALDMRDTDPAAVREYAEKWLRFQARFMETMPMAPLYSNMYFDFYRPELMNYDPSDKLSWATAIPDAYILTEEMQAELDAVAQPEAVSAP